MKGSGPDSYRWRWVFNKGQSCHHYCFLCDGCVDRQIMGNRSLIDADNVVLISESMEEAMGVYEE